MPLASAVRSKFCRHYGVMRFTRHTWSELLRLLHSLRERISRDFKDIIFIWCAYIIIICLLILMRVSLHWEKNLFQSEICAFLILMYTLFLTLMYISSHRQEHLFQSKTYAFPQEFFTKTTVCLYNKGHLYPPNKYFPSNIFPLIAHIVRSRIFFIIDLSNIITPLSTAK